jgi:hypothetical protein
LEQDGKNETAACPDSRAEIYGRDVNAETRRRGEEEKKEDKHAPPRTGRREKIIRPLLCLLRDLGGQSISLCEIFAICG